ncbi:MAG: DUF885 family protein, partial [Vicingaceae bacterium]
MKRVVLISLLAVLYACNSVNRKEEVEVESEFDFGTFKAEFIEAMWEINPISASYQGVHKYDAQLPIPNEARKEAKLQFTRSWLKRIQKFNYDSLSESDKIDYHLIEDDLKNSDFYVNLFKAG